MSRPSPRARLVLIAALIAIIASTVLWLRFSAPPRLTAPPEPAQSHAAPKTTLASSGTATITSASTPPPVHLMPTATELGAVIANRDDPAGALQAVDQAILFYRRAFGENPVGQNEDVTAAILGENPSHAAFLPPDSPAIKNGKLLDAWQTPYWFHPVSGTHMEIRSAGPDRELFTDDDLVLGQ